METEENKDVQAPEQDVAQPEAESAPPPTPQADGAAVATVPTPYKGFAGKLDKFFGISKAGSKFRTEIVGGLVTFMAMVYILFVNSDMLGELAGVSQGAIYIATALSAIVGTVLMSLLARMPLAQASGMGLNAFFTYTICFTFGLSYANALLLVLIDGIIFIILTVTGLRKHLFNAIPKAVRVAIPAGIGLFIAFIGFQKSGLVVNDDVTLVNLISFNFLGSATYGSVMPVLVTVIGVIVVAVLAKRGVKGAVLWAILGAAGLYWVFMGIGYGYGDTTCIEIIDGFSLLNPIDAFKDWGTQSVGQVFVKGFDFSGYLATHNGGQLALVIITSALAFCMVDMFDTMGTLYGACASGNLLDKDGNIPNINKSMLCDAIATSTGAIAGTSTVTTFVESSAGIGAGAKTGFASLITSLCFVVAMFLSPLVSIIPGQATAVALIYVGVLMMGCVKEIDWKDPAQSVPAFLTIALMPFTYNISYGIAFGIIAYLLIKLCTGKVKEIHPVTVVIGVLFALMFFLTH